MSDRERFITLAIFCIMFFIFSAFGIFKFDIHPLIKSAPFLGIGFYVFIRERDNRHKKKGT